MSKNPDITNDDLNEEIRSDNEDSINFFQGSEVVILHKNISDPVDEETQKMIDGLEALIKDFSASAERVAFNESIMGNEALDADPVKKRSVIMQIIDEVIRFLKDVGNWLMALLTNRLVRAQNKLNHLERRRKIKGIRQYQVRYPSSIGNLYMSSVSTHSAIWAVDTAAIGLNFYKKTVLAHKALIGVIADRPNTKEELKRCKTNALEVVGRAITDGKVSQIGFVTKTLPSNKVFNVVTKSTERNGSPFYFTHIATNAQLKSPTWEATSNIIDSGLELLRNYLDEIKKEQSNTDTLNRNFEKHIKTARKDANNWTIAYYNWLIETHRKFVSLTFQQVMRWYDTLEDFVSAGLN